MRQAGLSLIELMVAITIGLVITLAVTATYLSAIGTQRDDSDVTRLNETARFAFDLLARELRKAGFRNSWERQAPMSKNFCAGLTGSSVMSAIDGKNDPDSIKPLAADFSGTTYTVANKSDVLRVRYYGQGTTGSGDGSVTDCHGYSVGQGKLVEETLFVAVDPATAEPSLYCHAADLSDLGGTATLRHVVPLVTGVESLQLLYGVDTNADGMVDSYLPRQLVSSANLDNVISVKASIVVRSPDDTNPTATTVPVFKHFSTTSTSSFTYDTAANGDAGALFGGADVDSPKRKRLMISLEIATRNFRYCD
jgi:type IV pilus assembly protein PilW